MLSQIFKISKQLRVSYILGIMHKKSSFSTRKFDGYSYLEFSLSTLNKHNLVIKVHSAYFNNDIFKISKNSFIEINYYRPSDIKKRITRTIGIRNSKFYYNGTVYKLPKKFKPILVKALVNTFTNKNLKLIVVN